VTFLTSPGGAAAWRTFQQVRAGELDEADVVHTPAEQRKARVIVGAGGVPVAALVALVLLGTVGAFAISPPTSVRVGHPTTCSAISQPRACRAIADATFREWTASPSIGS
jgi:hypothetical protein